MTIMFPLNHFCAEEYIPFLLREIKHKELPVLSLVTPPSFHRAFKMLFIFAQATSNSLKLYFF